mmetsp:Transcript_15769/g.34074  ORF Transcript_15769/g.34074 Transcript_15769/m.34074 type:complete len:502 (+) Transcript_15769:2-1507(+)
METSRLRVLLACAGALLLLAASAVDAQSPTVVAEVLSNPNLSVLARAVTAANLVPLLSDPNFGPATIFAPTDAAFAALLSSLKLSEAQLYADQFLLTRVLQYHVVPGRDIYAKDLRDGATLPTLLTGQSLRIDRDCGWCLFFCNNCKFVVRGRQPNNIANFVTVDRKGGKVAIHVVDKVLLPESSSITRSPPPPPPAPPAAPRIDSIYAAVSATPDLSLLKEAIDAAGLAATLSDPMLSATAFAPTNAAFVALLGALGTTKDALFASKLTLYEVLAYHIVPGRAVAASLSNNQRLNTLVPMEQLTVRVVPTGVSIQGVANSAPVNVIRADAAQSNRFVAHIVDGVLLPKLDTSYASITEAVRSLPMTSTLHTLLAAARLTNALGDTTGTVKYTVLAPTDQAFVALLTALRTNLHGLLSNPSLLQRVLSYHLLPAAVRSTQLTPGPVATFLLGRSGYLNINITNGVPRFVGGRSSAGVYGADVTAGGSVVHVIDAVLLPADD